MFETTITTNTPCAPIIWKAKQSQIIAPKSEKRQYWLCEKQRLAVYDLSVWRLEPSEQNSKLCIVCGDVLDERR